MPHGQVAGVLLARGRCPSPLSCTIDMVAKERKANTMITAAANISQTMKAPVSQVLWQDYLPDIPYTPVCG
jgi:hypothetical protein